MIAAAFVLLLVSACRDARIDGSDPERARVTIVKARKSLPAERQNEFDRNLQLLMRHGGDPPILADARVRQQIDGKTAQEVITGGEALRRAEEARLHDEKVRKDIADIHASLSRIDAKNPAMKISKEPDWRSSTLGFPVPQTSTVGAADADVHVFCSQTFTNSIEELECEKYEVSGKAIVNGPLPDGVSLEVGGRVRENCRTKFGPSYSRRAGCESSDVASLNNVAAHPEVMKTLRPDRQQELRRLAGW